MSADDLDIRWYPDPCLRKRAKPITEIDAALRDVAERMKELMHRDRGVGLAGPQVGLPRRIFIMCPTAEPGGETVVLNPVISKRRGGKETQVEGCLSLPDVNGKIERDLACTLTYYDLEGEKHEMDLEGFPARVAQHEYDHLEGVLIIDRMSPAERSVVDARLRELAYRRERERERAGRD